MRAVLAVAMVGVLAGCATVRQQDLDAWRGVPVEALDTHSLFLTMPMRKTYTSSGIEVRDYMNGEDVSSCFGSGSSTLNSRTTRAMGSAVCNTARVQCDNIFYIRDGVVQEYAPRGRCMTDERVQPENRWRRLQR